MKTLKLWLKIIALLLVWGVLAPRYVKAQSIERQLIGSAGGNLSAADNSSINFSTGEPVAGNLAGSGRINQGFQQNWIALTPVRTPEAEALEVRVFPNPTPGLIHIECAKPAEIQLFDQQGRLLLEAENESGEIDISNYPPGYYSLRVLEKNGPSGKSFKLIKTQ